MAMVATGSDRIRRKRARERGLGRGGAGWEAIAPFLAALGSVGSVCFAAPTQASTSLPPDPIETVHLAQALPPLSDLPPTLRPDGAGGQVPSSFYYQEYQRPPAVGGPTMDEANGARSPQGIPSQSAADFPSPSSLPPAQFGTYLTPGADPTLTPFSAGASPSPPSGPPLGTVTAIAIEGATPELQQVIQPVIQTRPGAIATTAQLDADVSNILGTGLFTTATAVPQGSGGNVTVTYRVEPVYLQSVRLVGAQTLTPAIAASYFQGQQGQPVSPQAVQQSAQRINEWYASNGYSLAQVVSILVEPSGQVTLEVAEGIVGTVAIQFIDEDTGEAVDEEGDPVTGRTRESFLQEEIRLRSGQAFSETVAQQDVDRLAELGLFSQINLAIANQGETVDVVYLLAEVPSRRVNFGGGVNSSDGLFATVTYQDRNVGGVGDRLNIDTQVGRSLQFGVGFTSPYRESRPDELGWRVNIFQRRLVSRSFTNEVTLPNGDTAREGRLGGSVAVMRPIGEWDGELALNYTRVTVRERDGDLAPVDEEGNPLTFSDSGSDDLFTVSFGVTQDRRDDDLYPTTGSLLRLSTEQSLPIGNGSILMNRLQANYASYMPVDLLGMGNDEQPEVLAFNVQGGTILGDAPPYDAFNLGGGNSVRGYREGRIGTGRSYFLASTEYRFPVFTPVTGVLFADFATDLGSGDSLLGEPAEVRDKPGSGFGYGFGVRVSTPLGLIRADFGLTDQGESRLHFGFGQRF